MKDAAITIRRAAPNTDALSKLAERLRPGGLFIASIDRDGALLWQDPQIPDSLALWINEDPSLTQQIRTLSTNAPAKPPHSAATLNPTLPGLQVHAFPVARRRKLFMWVVMLARTGSVPAHAEELAHLAQKTQTDAAALAGKFSKLPLVAPDHFSFLANLAEKMYADLLASAGMTTEIESLTEQLATVYEEMALLYQLSSRMRFNEKPQGFLEAVCRGVQELRNFGLVGVALAAPGSARNEPVLQDLTVLAGNSPAPVAELLDILHEPIYDALAARETLVQNDVGKDCDVPPRCEALKRFVCVPLERDGHSLGALLAVNKNDAADFNSVNVKLLNNVGNQCSIFLQNAALYQDMQQLFLGVLHALTHSIDAKDPYTRGHSERVAMLSRALAQKIGLGDELCERIYLSGLLHDVGKIGVPEAVLTKAGKLTPEEFARITRHPEIGVQILASIKQLEDLLPGVLHHHERWDGRGYPRQLAAENIPLMGRIICIADTFDAMSSTRTYRAALPLETVLAEITRSAGSQLDPTLAKIFTTMDFTPYFNLAQSKQTP